MFALHPIITFGCIDGDQCTFWSFPTLNSQAVHLYKKRQMTSQFYSAACVQVSFPQP